MSRNCRAPARRSARTGRTASISRSRRSTPRAAFSAPRSSSPTPIRNPTPASPRRWCEKALDSEPYALLGPGYSGSVKVTEPLAAEAGIAEIMGGEAADLTQTGNKFVFRTSFGQQSEHAEDRQIHRRDHEGEDRRRRLGQQRLRQGRPRHDPEGIRRARRQGRRSTIRPKRARRISPPTRSR